MRPANIVTAVADVLAGAAISGYAQYFVMNYGHVVYNEIDYEPLLLLCLSTFGLYGGGIVFNDFFDAELDAVERPERSIPSGLIKKGEAAILGIILLAIGIISAWFVSLIAFIVAISIAFFALVYDKWGKHHSFLGPLNMGTCRGLNLFLGMCAVYFEWCVRDWYLAFVPLVYIFSITMISRGEVHGGKKTTLYIASFLYLFVISMILSFSYPKGNLLLTFFFILPFSIIIFLPLFKAIKEPIGPNIGKAVKAGVISLILMDAAWAMASGELMMALIITLLLPISFGLSKLFAVT